MDRELLLGVSVKVRFDCGIGQFGRPIHIVRVGGQAALFASGSVPCQITGCRAIYCKICEKLYRVSRGGLRGFQSPRFWEEVGTISLFETLLNFIA